MTKEQKKKKSWFYAMWQSCKETNLFMNPWWEYKLYNLLEEQLVVVITVKMHYLRTKQSGSKYFICQ